MNRRYVYLLKNMKLLTVSRFASKLLSFFLVPLYTNILTTAEYGAYDLLSATVSILVPILTLNIQYAVLRFALEKNANRNAIVTVSMRCLLAGCGIIFLGLGVNGIFHLSEVGEKYAVYFFLLFFLNALSGIVLSYIRGVERIAELSVSSVIASAVIIGCNIVFLVFFQWGLTGYFLANILGPLVQCLYLIFKSHMLREICHGQGYRHEARCMLHYSVPTIVNSIAWWVNNGFDRYVIAFFCGLAENGVYSIASKIPNILSTLQTIFNQAWELSAVSGFDPDDRTGFFSNTYKAYNCVMVIICSVIIVLDRMLARLLYARAFYTAWKYVPWLTIAIVFGALSGYLGGIFTAVKDSKMYAKSTTIGMAVNIILNIAATPFMGALGAAVATTICYAVIWVTRLRHSKRFIRLNINLERDITAYILLIVQSTALLLMAEDIWLYILETGLLIVILWLYFKDILEILNKVKKAGQSE